MPLNAITESFAYDASGRLILAENAGSQLQWYYNEVGNLVREHQHYRLRGSAFTAIWRHEYDALDNRVTTIRPDGHRVDWLSYGSGHVHGLLLDGQEQVGFERDDLHREIRRTFGNTDRGQLAASRSYDPAGRLTEQLLERVQALSQTAGQAGGQTTSNATVSHRQYQYDAAGQLLGISDSRRGALQYHYDPVGRLLAATSRLGQETFAFDPAGNLLDPQTADQRQYDTRERAEQQQFHSQLTGSNKLLDNLLKDYAGKHFEYDERGNLRARIDNGRTQWFEWDHFNRLAAVRSNEVDTEFAYDPLGRRLLKHSTPKLPIGAGAQAAVNPAWVASETARLSREHGYGVTLYGWDGDQIAWEGDAETTTHYVFEPGSFVPLLQAKTRQRIPLLPTPDWSERDYDIDADPLWTYSPEPQPFEQLYYYHTDHLGTPQELLDAEGNLAWSADYKAWGEAKAAISDAAKRAGISNPLRFQGQYFDHETGLHYNRHRYYDPQIGRFISKDPISLMGGLNIFAYAPNPVHWVDPQGLAANGQLGTYGTLTGRANRRDQLEAHELIRNEALEQMGCGAKTKKGNPKRHPDNPSIALDLPTHDNVHIIENDLAKQHLGVGVNEFQLDNNRPTKRQMDVWQGALRKSGVGASQARRLRKNSEKFLKDLCCCP